MCEYSQIIQFVHDRFVNVCSQADAIGVAPSTLTRAMHGLTTMRPSTWARYRRMLLADFAYVRPVTQAPVQHGWHFAPDAWGVGLEGWLVYVLVAPDAALIIYEHDGKVHDLDEVPIPKMQRLEDSLLSLQWRVNYYLSNTLGESA